MCVWNLDMLMRAENKLNIKTMIKIKRYKKNEQDRGEEDSV